MSILCLTCASHRLQNEHNQESRHSRCRGWSIYLSVHAHGAPSIPHPLFFFLHQSYRMHWLISLMAISHCLELLLHLSSTSKSSSLRRSAALAPLKEKSSDQASPPTGSTFPRHFPHCRPCPFYNISSTLSHGGIRRTSRHCVALAMPSSANARGEGRQPQNS